MKNVISAMKAITGGHVFPQRKLVGCRSFGWVVTSSIEGLRTEWETRVSLVSRVAIFHFYNTNVLYVFNECSEIKNFCTFLLSPPTTQMGGAGKKQNTHLTE